MSLRWTDNSIVRHSTGRIINDSKSGNAEEKVKTVSNTGPTAVDDATSSVHQTVKEFVHAAARQKRTG